ncbi:hypothetical protein [Verrucomicrobium sp. BvORR034]|uniref:hypothetical protein n=1 Tax=Verrucomicrobium sp. BvORR034 TaxID=1396418 RepID=UPI000679C11D|nr:hypothetical protein [Verrucomicrobium sp. BvORR034]
MKTGTKLILSLLLLSRMPVSAGEVESFAAVKEGLRVKVVKPKVAKLYEFRAEEIFYTRFHREDMPTYGPFSFEDQTTHQVEAQFVVGAMGKFVVVFLPMSPPVVIDSYYTTFTRQGRYSSVEGLQFAALAEMMAILR